MTVRDKCSEKDEESPRAQNLVVAKPRQIDRPFVLWSWTRVGAKGACEQSAKFHRNILQNCLKNKRKLILNLES